MILRTILKKQTSFQLLKPIIGQSVCSLIALQISHLDHLIGNLILAFWTMQLINSEYPNWSTEFSEVNDKRLLWDLIKYSIRQTAIQYNRTIAKKRKAPIQQVEETLKQSEEIFNNNPSEENVSKLDEARREYDRSGTF